MARIAVRASAVDVSSELGRHPQCVADFEYGKTAPGIYTLMAWGRLFGLRLILCDERGDRSLPEVKRREGETWEQGEYRRLAADLHDARRVKGFTHSELGALLGVRGPTVLRWEQAQRRPEVSTATRWARELGCVLQWRTIQHAGKKYQGGETGCSVSNGLGR